jgi:hypothetical protein
MGTVGQKERLTQNRIVRLFQDSLKYDYLGNWEKDRENRNIEEHYLRAFWKKKRVSETLANKALYELNKVAGDQTKSLYDVNKEVYGLLRYGVKVREEAGGNSKTVMLIDWENPENNHFAIAEEVAVSGQNTKRPDIVLYVNGIALGILELKRSVVSVSEGIRQNLDNQKKEFIERFFTTVQFVMAGNDTQGLRYAPIGTPEKYYLTWKEESEIEDPLDRALLQLCEKNRLLELIHNFIVYDAGTKKLCRHNQYFGVKAAQERIRKREGGVIWHTQGSGKSLTMVWLAKWIHENIKNSRVLVITDRIELDQQIEGVFKGVEEDIRRTKSGADLVGKLNQAKYWLIGSLIHKFPGQEEGNVSEYIDELKNNLPKNFKAKGDIFVFVDECHRTQSGDLHKAMKSILLLIAASFASALGAAAPWQVYTNWPFDAAEAVRRQNETAAAPGLPAEKSIGLTGGVTAKFRLIPAGRYMMGSPPGEKGRKEHEGPQHRLARRVLSETEDLEWLLLAIARRVQLRHAVAVEVVEREHLHVAARARQQLRFPCLVHPPRLAALRGAPARVPIPVDAVLVPAAGDHVRPAVLVHVVDVVAVRVHVVLRDVARPERARHEVGSGEPVGAGNDVDVTVPVEVADGGAFVGTHEQLPLREAQGPVLGGRGGAGQEAEQHHAECRPQLHEQTLSRGRRRRQERKQLVPEPVATSRRWQRGRPQPARAGARRRGGRGAAPARRSRLGTKCARARRRSTPRRPRPACRRANASRARGRRARAVP